MSLADFKPVSDFSSFLHQCTLKIILWCSKPFSALPQPTIPSLDLWLRCQAGCVPCSVHCPALSGPLAKRLLPFLASFTLTFSLRIFRFLLSQAPQDLESQLILVKHMAKIWGTCKPQFSPHYYFPLSVWDREAHSLLRLPRLSECLSFKG